ncbi:MAG: PAS domain S-box protein [Thermodesulfobacteriota bacterium]|nr:PAS domain S-box protein [Thermodesulfobacteriota bacterium]
MMLKKKRFSRVLIIAVILLSSISITILSSVLFFYFSHRLEAEFTQKMSSQIGELELLIKNRLDGLNGRLHELSLNNTIRVTMMLGVASQLDEQMLGLYPASDGACFFIRDDTSGTIYPETRPAGISDRLIDRVLSIRPRGTLIEDDGRKRFLHLFSTPIMRRTERLGTTFCLYDMLADRKLIETIYHTVDGDVFFLAKDGSIQSIRGTTLDDKPGMYTGVGLSGFQNLYYTYTLESLKKQKIWFLLLIAGASVLVLAMFVLMAIVLIRQITSSLSDMAGRAARISKGEKDVAFDEKGSDYMEFNQLSGAFNFMLKSLREAEEKSRYEELFENVADCVWITDLEGNLLDANEEYRRVHGCGRDDLCSMNLSSIMSGEDAAAILGTAREERIKTLDLLLQAADGTMIPTEINAKEITYLGKKAVLCVARDITDRKEAEKALRKSEERYRSVFENTGTATVILEEDATISMANTGFEKLSGYSREEIEGREKWTEFVVSEDLERMREYAAERRKNGGKAPTEYEFRFDNKRDSIKDIFLKIDMIPGTKKSVASLIDITARKKAEEETRRSLREKESLLAEIHHRVKNNMQIVSSLLSLQSKDIKDERALSLIKNCDDRIRSMSLIHEKLYLSKDLSSIDFHDYMEDLSARLFQTYRVDSRAVTFSSHIKDVRFNIETAMPLGLIANELISNALKYAFPEDKKGEIAVKLTKNKKTEGYTLTVTDDGIGFPEKIDYRNTETFGLQLVDMLTEQLGSTIKLDRSKGTTFKIVFKERKYKKRI